MMYSEIIAVCAEIHTKQSLQPSYKHLHVILLRPSSNDEFDAVACAVVAPSVMSVELLVLLAHSHCDAPRKTEIAMQVVYSECS